VLRILRARLHDAELQDHYVSDGNSAHSDAEHAATLASFYSVFGDVMDTDTLIGSLRTNAARYAQAAD